MRTQHAGYQILVCLLVTLSIIAASALAACSGLDESPGAESGDSPTATEGPRATPTAAPRVESGDSPTATERPRATPTTAPERRPGPTTPPAGRETPAPGPTEPPAGTTPTPVPGQAAPPPTAAATRPVPTATPLPPVDPKLIHGGPWSFETDPAPLHLSAVSGTPAELEHLLQDADIRGPVTVQNTEGDYQLTGMTALHLAAAFNSNPGTADLLLLQGADLEAQATIVYSRSSERPGQRPLHLAAAPQPEPGDDSAADQVGRARKRAGRVPHSAPFTGLYRIMRRPQPSRNCCWTPERTSTSIPARSWLRP